MDIASSREGSSTSLDSSLAKYGDFLEHHRLLWRLLWSSCRSLEDKGFTEHTDRETRFAQRGGTHPRSRGFDVARAERCRLTPGHTPVIHRSNADISLSGTRPTKYEVLVGELYSSKDVADGVVVATEPSKRQKARLGDAST
jgi:hypothetical protein